MASAMRMPLSRAQRVSLATPSLRVSSHSAPLPAAGASYRSRALLRPRATPRRRGRAGAVLATASATPAPAPKESAPVKKPRLPGLDSVRYESHQMIGAFPLGARRAWRAAANPSLPFPRQPVGALLPHRLHFHRPLHCVRDQGRLRAQAAHSGQCRRGGLLRALGIRGRIRGHRA